jgi:iron complex transport system substrate-binding protein
MRVVSLLPAATEIVCALGQADALVGRSHECDWPAFARALPALTSSKLGLDGTSYEIDARVRALIGEGLSIYRVDPLQLGRLRPDLILTQLHCEVCAASERDVEAALATWLGRRPTVVALSPCRLADVLADVHRIATALSVPDAGNRVVAELARTFDECAATAAASAKTGRARPRVLCLEWLDPPMAEGNWMPELVAIAGGEPLLAAAGEHSPVVTWAAVADADPDVLVLMPCGYDLARSAPELAPLLARPEVMGLRAVRTGRAFAVDGNALFNRPGPRLAESVRVLAGLIAPGGEGAAAACAIAATEPRWWMPIGPGGGAASRG